MDRLLKFVPPVLREPAETLLIGSGEGARSGRGALAAFTVRAASAVLAFLTQIFLARWMGAFDVAREKFLKAPFALKHGLADHPLFTLERLVQLAQAMPRDRIEYNCGKLLPGQ